MTRPDEERDVPFEPFEVEDTLLESNHPNTKKNSSPNSRTHHHHKRKKLSSKQEAKVLKIFTIILSALFVVVVVVLLLTNTRSEPSREASAAAHTGTTYDNNFNMKQNWGSYSPYFDTGSHFEGVSKTALDGEFTLPNTCRLKEVHAIHRHGDRYPAEGTSTKMQRVANKLKDMVKKSPVQGTNAWLNDWEYKLGSDLLVGSGVGALFESGARFWGSHGRLLYGEKAEGLPAWSDSINVWPNGTQRHKPVIRATTQDRIEKSARAWAAGFFGTFGTPSSGIDPREHYDLVLMEEEVGVNNTLAGYLSCPNADKPGAETGRHRSKKWVKQYLADAATRIQKMLPEYEDLTPEDALAIQDLCIFETAAFGASAFCGWFTEQEWRGFEYHADLKFYGESAWGSKVGPAVGLGWLAELHARLNKRRITAPTNGVNVTLDSDPSTFPTDQPFYIDFSHDSTIVSILAAMQFPFTKQNLPSHKIQVPRQFIVSRLTPFAARLYVEVLECGEGGNRAQYVRLKLNDRLLPIGDLKHCEDSEKQGMCALSDFKKSLEWALHNVDFDDICYGDKNWEKEKDE